MANMGIIKKVTVIGVALALVTGLYAPPASAAGPKQLVQVTSIGGFVAPAWQASRLPQLVLLSDGTVLVESPTPVHGYVRQAYSLKLSAASTSQFVKNLIAATATPPGGWGMPPVADMPNTRFLITSGTTKVDVTIGAFEYTGSGLTAAQTKARKNLRSMLSSLKAGVVKAKRNFKPSSYEIWGLTAVLDNGGVGIANPASVYCQTSGGTTNIVDTPDGQVGYCQLPSGENVEEWANYRSAMATLPAWPTGVALPGNDPNNLIMTCTAVAASKVSTQLANKDDGGRWLLPSGQALPVVLRPVLTGESACHRTW